jgi:cytochrome c-type biogenesis protein CcmH/NrfF
VRRLVLVVLAALLVGVLPAGASESRWTIDEISQDLMCPTCQQGLAMSQSSEANQIRDHLRAYQRQGLTRSQAEHQLVLEYGRQVLASPPRSGFGLAAWLAPAALVLVGALIAAACARRWARARRREHRVGALALAGPERLDLERRLDAELQRFDE